jgi:ABC-type amino acid transport substrate-binding protein
MRHSVLMVFALVGLTANAFAQAPAESRLNTIAKNKTVKIAYRSDASPFSFMKDQKPVGYTIDLCTLVVASMEKQLGAEKLSIEWVPVTTQSRFEAVESGKADMECGSSTITLSRMKQVDFSSVTFVEATGVVVKAASGIKTAADLGGKKIAVITGTTNEQALKRLQEAGRLNVTLTPVSDRAQGVAALQGGAADGFASDKLLLVGAEFKDAGAYTLLPDDLSHEAYGIVVPRGDWALRLAVNTALAQTYRSGQGLQIFRKWFEQVGLRPSALMFATYQLGGYAD